MMNVTGGATNVTTYFQLINVSDGSDATGLTITDFDLTYTRTGATPAAKVDATALAAANSAHADNKMIEVDATDAPGLYRVDWPDAAFAAAVSGVALTVKHTDIQTATLWVNIDSPVDVTKISGDSTAADNCEAMFDGTGYAGGTIKLDVDTVAISGDTTAADNCEAMFDGTGYAGGTIKLGVDTVAISGDTGAADNCEADYDGTGYVKSNSTVGTATTVTNEVTADMTKISGDSTAADNAEAFFDDTGFVASNSTIGTCTANTDMVGTNNAALAATALTDATWTDARAGYLDALNSGVTLANDAITAAKYDESTAYPVASADSGATQIARTGADADTLETLSDQLDDKPGLTTAVTANNATFQAVLKNLNSMAKGNFYKAGDVYTFYDDDDDGAEGGTLLFTNTITSTKRTGS